MGTLSSYVPYDYRRLCDLCGNPYNISKLRRQGPYMVCSDHAGERINEELDRGNARARPFRILPVPNAKPNDQGQPDVFESEESVIFALLDRVIGSGARYAQVESGTATPVPDAADVIPTNAWACRHYYGLALATYPKGHVDEWHDQSLVRMRTSADLILARQTLTATRATNSFHGGFLASGGTAYYSEDASTGGLALLYAYRLLGDGKYLWGARNAASFLRNLQAIGSDGVNFTSSDSAGLARLYTGAITNSVSTVAGFYADHAFYLSSLLALQFWNELKITDGDQSLGATAAIASEFTTAPAKLLSACMADLRAFWETGTYDATALAVRTGLAATTPAEFFNAYPFLKPNTLLSGTGSWEYFDGAASVGTIVSSLNVAKAISALFAFEGLSAQVIAVDDWLASFTSNAAFETAAGTSARDLARATTGTYDTQIGVPQYLLVRDASSAYAAVKKNGGSLYEWGSFGLLSPIWASRHALALKQGRNAASISRRRLSDGQPSDGFWDDRGFLRGRQGLTMQTAFREVLAHGPGSGPSPAVAQTTPPTNNMVLWFKADAGVTMNASNQVSTWADQGPHHLDMLSQGQNASPLPTSDWPVFTPNAINGLPGLLFTSGPGTFDGTGMNHLYASQHTSAPLADGQPVTCLALFRPTPTGPQQLAGGSLVTLGLFPPDLSFENRLTGGFPATTGFLGDQTTYHWGLTGFHTYVGVTMVQDWEYPGANLVPTVFINGQPQVPLVSSGPLTAYVMSLGISLGYINADFQHYFDGYITEILIYGSIDPGTVSAARAYLQTRAGTYTSAMVYDGVTAAQFAISLRQAPRS